MVASLVVLLVYQLVGEVTVRFFGLDLPGPVLGMALLLLTLMARRRLSVPFANTTRGLLDHLGLLYVPAGAGLISQIDRLQGHWLGLIATVVISTVLTLVVCGWTMQLMMRWTGTAEDGGSVAGTVDNSATTAAAAPGGQAASRAAGPLPGDRA
ncbi:CidA/LrgA family protein [Derxia gummosa]|uniref:CidA/LrgA family protein n=1 Tax=Derxia gummosa DSM 723 TaxID=1121388 RepID=A0A8B6X9N4_9BURK|nr:CidA/LrgA family protein [Derxia gummosa]